MHAYKPAVSVRQIYDGILASPPADKTDYVTPDASSVYCITGVHKYVHVCPYAYAMDKTGGTIVQQEAKNDLTNIFLQPGVFTWSIAHAITTRNSKRERIDLLLTNQPRRTPGILWHSFHNVGMQQ